MLNLTVTVQNGVEVVGRLQLLGDAAKVFGDSRVFVGSALNYAVYVVNGTRPHLILPRAKKALYWPGAAHPVRSVQHPGTKPNAFMTDALAAVGPQIEAGIAADFKSVAAGEGRNYRQIMMSAGFTLQSAIQLRLTPGHGVKTGGLRASFHTEIVA